MGRVKYRELIVESAEALLLIEKEQTRSYLKDRVRYLRYLKTEVVNSQQEAGNLIGLQVVQSKKLWRLYLEGGLKALLTHHPRGYNGKLSKEEYEKVLSYLDEDKACTQYDIQEFINTTLGKKYTQSGISLLCKRLKIKNKTGRPTNVRKDE